MGIAIIGIFAIIAGFVIKGLNKQTSDRADLKPTSWLLIVGGTVVFLVGLLVSSVVIIQTGYAGVKLRLGAIAGSLNEGIHLIVPGVEQVIRLEVRTQKEESKATAASRDLQTVTTDLALNFRVDKSKVDVMYQQVGTEYKARIIDPAVQEAIKVVTAKYTAEDLIRQRQKVKDDVEQEISSRLAQYNLLVEPDGLSITNFEFSPEFNRAIEAKQVAQQEAEKQKYVLQQAELEQQTKIARAKGEAEAAKLNAESLKAQGGSLVVAREWIEKWDGKLPQVSSGSGGGGMILDLKSMLDQANKQ